MSTRPTTNGHQHHGAEERVKGNSYVDRMQAAAARLIGDANRATNIADRLSDELDDVTPVHGVRTVELHEEDSLVTATADLLKTAKG